MLFICLNVLLIYYSILDLDLRLLIIMTTGLQRYFYLYSK